MNYTATRRFLSGLRKLQNALSITNTDFAQLLGIGRTTLADWRSGKNKPDPETVDMIFSTLRETHERTVADASAVLAFIGCCNSNQNIG